MTGCAWYVFSLIKWLFSGPHAVLGMAGSLSPLQVTWGPASPPGPAAGAPGTGGRLDLEEVGLGCILAPHGGQAEAGTGGAVILGSEERIKSSKK